MLAVVQHQQHRPVADVVGNNPDRSSTRLRREANRVEHRTRQRTRIAYRRQLDPPRPTVEVLDRLGGNLQSQPRLSDTARADQRHQPAVPQCRQHRRSVRFPTDQRCQTCRQVVAEHTERAQRPDVDVTIAITQLPRPAQLCPDHPRGPPPHRDCTHRRPGTRPRRGAWCPTRAPRHREDDDLTPIVTAPKQTPTEHGSTRSIARQHSAVGTEPAARTRLEVAAAVARTERRARTTRQNDAERGVAGHPYRHRGARGGHACRTGRGDTPDEMVGTASRSITGILCYSATVGGLFE